jgi:hypothetical protein
MKDQYVGDVNDYLKYALLRAVSEPSELAVVWMLTASDARSDGLKLGYLHQSDKYRHIDPVLFDSLAQLVADGLRSVREIEQALLLGDAVFVSDVLDDTKANRSRYVACACATIEQRRIVFFDPDNGLAVSSVAKGARGSSKYLYWDEVAAVYARGHSLLIYQHFPRRPRQEFLRSIAGKLQETTGCTRVLAVATPHVAFLLLPRVGDEANLLQRVLSFTQRTSPYVSAFDSHSVQ